MKKDLLKILLFILIVIFMVYINMAAFRSDYPLIWIATLITCIIILIVFPYTKFFKQN